MIYFFYFPSQAVILAGTSKPRKPSPQGPEAELAESRAKRCRMSDSFLTGVKLLVYQM